MTGLVLLVAVLCSSLGAGICYALESNTSVSKKGNRLMYLSGLFSLVAFCYLYSLIFANRFDIAYVAGYSSIGLPLLYKISAFWAGQQGSFLLWLFIHAAVGVFLTKTGRMNTKALLAYAILQSAIAFLVIGKNPFTPAEIMVQDGAGLNPLLEDPWMAVHPPVIFLGYALLAVPFAYSMGDLLSGEKHLLERARSWTISAWGFLGAGIFIGGYWAYKVLGWGGYWGWDPVENSSLVPWLLATILIHLLKAAKVRDNFLPMAHLSAIFTYGFVIYGTFLTRSGVLGDFSVHSFSEESIGLAIAVINALILLGGLILLTVKIKTLPQGDIYDSFRSREFSLALGMLLLAFVAAVVFVGMSMPLFTGIFGTPAAVDTGFYVKMVLPLTFVFLIVMYFACVKNYGVDKSFLEPKTALVIFFLGSMLGNGAAHLAGGAPFLDSIVAGAAGAVLLGSIIAYKNNYLSLGGAISHSGASLAIMAMVTAGSAGVTNNAVFNVNEAQTFFGREITYLGQEFHEDQNYKLYVFQVDGERSAALTKLRANGQDAAREPAIVKSFGGDLYLAPSPPETRTEEIVINQDEIVIRENCALIYEGFTENDEGEVKNITANVFITDEKGGEPVALTITADKKGASSHAVPVLDNKKRLRLTALSQDGKRIRLELSDSLDTLSNAPVNVSVSNKPFIWALWLGAALTVAGAVCMLFTGVFFGALPRTPQAPGA